MRHRLVLAASVLLAAGCFGDLIRDQARTTASRDHGCALDQVTVISDASVGGDSAYWLNVCGQRRYYRYEQTSSAGIGSGRFIDDTQRMAPTPAPTQPAPPAATVSSGGSS